ncbi:MAG TPA: thioesterase family protein [Meiothermus sp.]|jgi:acyl-CoA thioester hydrolase|nr:thioesterase family protein [Meiothermus sp.]
MAKTHFKFCHRLRVRWAETDPQGIVFNGHYLTYCDVAITEYWRAIGYPYPSTIERLGVDLFVVKSTLEYRSPARYDDEIDVYVRTGRIGNSSMQMLVKMYRGEEHLVSGEIIYVSANAETRKPQTVPEELRKAIGALEDSPAHP